MVGTPPWKSLSQKYFCCSSSHYMSAHHSCSQSKTETVKFCILFTSHSTDAVQDAAKTWTCWIKAWIRNFHVNPRLHPTYSMRSEINIESSSLYKTLIQEDKTLYTVLIQIDTHWSWARHGVGSTGTKQLAQNLTSNTSLIHAFLITNHNFIHFCVPRAR